MTAVLREACCSGSVALCQTELPRRFNLLVQGLLQYLGTAQSGFEFLGKWSSVVVVVVGILDLHLSSLAPSLTLAYFFKLSIKLSTGETLYIAEQQIILSKAAGSILELSPHAPTQTFTTRNIL